MTQNIPGVSLGSATAILEVEVSQLTRAERAVTQTISNIAKAQEMLLRGDQALQASAKTTLGILQQQQRVSKGQAATAARQETQELRQQATLTEAITRSEQQRSATAKQTAQALEQQTRQLQQQGAIAERLAAAARIRQAAEQSGSFVGQLRQDAFDGGLPAAGRRGGGGGFGAGNPNIPTFAQFGLFPFAGLAGSLGATGLQQGILGASSVLGIAELGATRNAITRLGTQLQGLGGIFGSLATGGARAAQALGAQSGGLVSSLASIGAAALPLVGLIGGLALLTTAIDNLQQGVDRAVENIQRRAEQIAGGTTSEQLSGDIQRQQTSIDVQRTAIAQLREIFEEARGQVSLTPDQQGRVEAITGAPLEGAGFGTFAALRLTIEDLEGKARDAEAALAGDVATLESTEIAENDAAAALRASTEAQQAYAASVLETQVNAEQAARELTTSELQQKIRDLQQQFADMTRIMQDPESTFQYLSEEAKQQFNERAALLQVELEIYQRANTPLRDFVLFLRNLPDILSDNRERAEDLNRQLERQAEDDALRDQRQEADRNRQRLRALEDFGRETQQAEEEFQRQRQRVIDDAARADAELVAEAAERRQDIIDEYNEREAEAEEEHQNRIAKILREGRTRILEAAARLDARGVLETQRRIADQLAEENERREEAREEARETLEEALADLDENLEEQRRRRQEDLQRRLQEMASEFALQQQRRREDFVRRLQQEDQERALQDQREAQDRAIRRQRQIDDFNRQLSDQIQHFINLEQIQRNGLDFLRQGYQNWINSQVAAQQDAFAGYGAGVYGGAALVGHPIGGTGVGRGGSFRPTPFAQGIGRVPRDMLASLHAGERVLTPLQAAEYDRNTGGMSVVVNINGDIGNNSLPQVRDAASSGTREALNEYMRQMASQGISMLNSGDGR